MIILFISAVVLALLATNLFVKGEYLKTETVEADEIQGGFTLILFGGNDPKQAVFLDREDDEYTFVMSESSHNFTVTKGVSAGQSLQEAVDFLDSENHRISRIVHKKKTLGYEVRPIYQTVRFGHSDILDIRYRVEDKKVRISVEVKRAVRKTYERDLYGGD